MSVDMTINAALVGTVFLAGIGGWISIRSWQGEIRSWREATNRRLDDNDTQHLGFMTLANCTNLQKSRMEIEKLKFDALQVQIDAIVKSLEKISLNVESMKGLSQAMTILEDIHRSVQYLPRRPTDRQAEHTPSTSA